MDGKSVKISDDQNSIEIRAVFVQGGGCLDCAFYNLTDCDDIPCTKADRNDGKDGHFIQERPQ